MKPEEARQQMDEWRVKTFMAQDEKTKQLIRLLEPEAQMAWLDANLIEPAESAEQAPATKLTPHQQQMARLAGMSEDEYLKYSDRSMAIERPQSTVTTPGNQTGQLTEVEKAMARNFNLTEAEYFAAKKKAGQ